MDGVAEIDARTARDWRCEEAAVLAGVGIADTAFADLASYRRWWLRLPPHGKAFAAAWLPWIERARSEGDAGVASRLRGLMRVDVLDTLAHLADGASPACIAAWRTWYPEHVKGFALLAWLPRASEQPAQPVQAAHERRTLRIARRFGDYMRANDYVVAWRPARIARALASCAPGDTTCRAADLDKLAALCVDHGRAAWLYSEGDRVRLFVLTGHL